MSNSIRLEYNEKEDDYVFKIPSKKDPSKLNTYTYEQLESRNYFSSHPNLKELYLSKKRGMEEEVQVTIQKERQVNNSNRELSTKKILNSLIEMEDVAKGDHVNVNTFKDDMAIASIEKQILQLKNKYGSIYLNYDSKEGKRMLDKLNDLKNKAEKDKETYTEMEDNIESFIWNITNIDFTGLMHPIFYYLDLIKNIRVEEYAYRGIGVSGTWFSAYLRKPIYMTILNDGFEGLWYATYKGSIIRGKLKKTGTKSKGNNKEIIERPKGGLTKGPVLPSSTNLNTTKKETKEFKDDEIGIEKGVFNPDIDIDLNKDDKLLQKLEAVVRKKESFTVIMQCTIITPFGSRSGQVSLEIDANNPGIYNTAGDIFIGAKTYAFRAAAGLLFPNLRGIKWSSATGTLGLGYKSSDEFMNIGKEIQINSLQSKEIGMIEDKIFFNTKEEINLFNQLQGALMMSNTNRLLIQGSENIITNMTNNSNDIPMIKSISNNNSYQQVQEDTHMEQEDNIEENKNEEEIQLVNEDPNQFHTTMEDVD